MDILKSIKISVGQGSSRNYNENRYENENPEILNDYDDSVEESYHEITESDDYGDSDSDDD
ncbi:hypothetical protein [Methanochimaera problematica]|nr:hypothetical protein [Methanoplanus sp. FWC-SCC4]